VIRDRSVSIVRRFIVCGAIVVSIGACGGSDEVADVAAAPVASAAAPAEAGADELPNACPVEGCKISIVSAERNGDEIALVFETNYTPDFERNHMHVFWDSQEPGSVSSDFAAKGFAVQGKWNPTDEYPGYSTQADASVLSEFRGDSTTICVTAGDTDHAVIDATLVDCRDVSELLS
jgi:hypothetical protein